jgi:multidrug resistance protein MdtO
MTVDAIGRGWRLPAFLAAELAPRPGRIGAVARIAICCTIVVFTTMLYQIPEPAYAAYIVFFLGRGDQAVTVMTGIVGGLGITLATGLTVLFYLLDAGEPALRLPVMAVSTFLGMYLLRTLKLGPVAFLAGFLLTVTQSIIDDIPNLEALTRFVLWLWVVVLLPDVVTVLVNLLAGQNPAKLARAASRRLLDGLGAAIRTGDTAPLGRLRDDALALVELRAHAGMLDRELKARNALDTGLIEIVLELVTLATLLPPATDASLRGRLADACRICRDALDGGAESLPAPISPPEIGRAEQDAGTLAVATAMANALQRLADGIARRSQTPDAASKPAGGSGLVPDAFTNPDHARFALKTTIAAMSAYIIYSGLAWSGIRTSLITCFFVALSSLGETMHKLTLRLSGAMIGGLLGSLSIVFLLPHMEDIGDLSLLIASATALFAWVATSSELLSYAGMQMALAFYMGVLQGYGPSTDLTVLRDRVVGVLLGNVLMSLVFSVIWPVSAQAQARGALAGTVRKLAQLLSADAAGLRLAALQGVARARLLLEISPFETVTLPPSPSGDKKTLGIVDRLAARVFAVVEQPADSHRTENKAIAAWLSGYADGIAGDQTAVPLQREDDDGAVMPENPADAARTLLRAEIERIAPHAA